MIRSMFLTLSVFLPLTLGAESVTVLMTVNGKTTTEYLTVVRSQDNGLSWEEISGKAGITRSGYADSGALKAVSLEKETGKWSLRQDGDVLTMTGVTKGKDVKGTLALKGRIWSVGLDHPVAWAVSHSLKKELVFVIVDPEKFGEPAELTLRFEAEEKVEGKDTLRFKIGLPGPLSLLWSAKVWADPLTGRQVLFRGTGAPGAGETTISQKWNP